MNKSIIVFPLLSWDSELVHRDQMLAKEFARAGVSTYFIDRITRKPWKIFGKRMQRSIDGVNVVSVFVLPYLRGRISFIYLLNNYLIGRQVRGLYDNIGAHAILYISNPDWSVHVSKFANDRTVVYDMSDDYAALTTNLSWSKIVTKNEVLAKKIASKYIVTSSVLAKDFDKKKPMLLVSNGVDLTGFSSAKAVINREKYKHIAGFIGGIYNWVDLELVGTAAKSYPETMFILIGPTNRQSEISKLTTKNPNVRYLGAKPKDEISGYFASFDAGLVPFVSETDYPRLATVDSAKIYQYLFFGYPVIATSFAQSRVLSNLISVAENKQDFIVALGKALSEGRNDKRKQFALQNTWDHKAKDILEFINK